MKASPWFWAGISGISAAVLAFFLVGWLLPGGVELPGLAEAKSPPFLAEAKKRMETFQILTGGLSSAMKKGIQGYGLTGAEKEHRVFVSPILVYLPKNAEPVQPLDRKMKTDDGIEIGWKMKYGFDPADPAVAEQDPDEDGFTNFEEFAANPQTDPLRKEDSPAKESKLKSRSRPLAPMQVSFVEKGGGTFTVRFLVGQKRGEFKGKVGDVGWIMAGPGSVVVFKDQEKMNVAVSKAKEAGQNSHVIPVKILSYLEKIEKIKDAKTGGVEIEKDNSSLVLQRGDALQESVTLPFSIPTDPRSLTWEAGEIVFFTPSSGGKELGPYRIGETFIFGEKEFSILKREGDKIQLAIRGDDEPKPFWVPPEPVQRPPTPPAP